MMHELPVVREILRISLECAESARAVRVEGVRLAVGALRDFDEGYVTSFFQHLSKGTIAQDARISIRVIPASFRCADCGKQEVFDPRELADPACGGCGGKNLSLATGSELVIDSVNLAFEGDSEDAEREGAGR